MNIRIKATNITLTPHLTEYIDKSLAKVTKIVGNDPALICDVEVGKTNNHHNKGDIFMAEIHIVGNGTDAYATATHEDLNMAITDVRDEIVRELHSHKNKKISYIRRSGARAKAIVKGIVPWGDEGWYRRFRR